MQAQVKKSVVDERADHKAVSPPSIKNAPPAPATLEEVEALTNELKRLLVLHQSTLEGEGIRHHVETMERWMESYRRGIAAAHKLSENAPGWLEQVRARLTLASDELQRLESEGGNPATAEQSAEADRIVKAVREMDTISAHLEGALAHIGDPPATKTDTHK